MKKSIGMILSSVMLVGLLAGCGGKSGNGNASPSASPSGEATPSSSPSASASASPSASSSGDVVTLKYATWNDPVLEQKKLDAFMKAHPNIKIEIDKSVTWPWDEKLGAAAAAGKMPDVFFVFNGPSNVANGWLADMKPYLDADADYKPENIFGNLSDTGAYNGKQYMLPHQLFMQGVLINVDLFNKENIPLPTKDWTIKDFEKIAKKLTKVSDHQFGVQNLLGARELFVPQFDPSLGWLTYDGKQFNFDKPAFSDTIHWINNVVYNDKTSVDLYERAEQDKWYGKDKDAFVAGKIGMKVDANWAFADVAKNAKFKWDFLPLPGNKGQRLPLITDYIGMAANTEHPKEAFEFIKWLTYSKDGWTQRINEIEKPITSLPLVNDRDVWDAYMSTTYTAPGLKDAIAMIPDGFVDGYKWLPGDAEIIDKVLNPYDTKKELVSLKVKPEDVAKDIQKKAMDIFNKNQTQIGAVTK
ncbi:extracellular solute-binding protein [Cohnella sp. REN36]|uniref:extracellular solute-binding protein n=1 Tax=Cohnella sp. REN36 TaxID=2887347 RepID=UPI001D14BBFB|nr:extracellular solute-binding protein [Cohnella sp. REN36]MCC3374554.1 extracellular solute-binding protein [Cohnella sp. REN36]